MRLWSLTSFGNVLILNWYHLWRAHCAFLDDKINTPCTCARGKAIGLSICHRCYYHRYKITRSWVLGIYACCKHIAENGLLALYQECIFCSACLRFIDHTYSTGIVLSMLRLSEGKGRQVITTECCNTTLQSQWLQNVWSMCSREL